MLGHGIEADKVYLDELLSKCRKLKKVVVFRYDGETDESFDKKGCFLANTVVKLKLSFINNIPAEKPDFFMEDIMNTQKSVEKYLDYCKYQKGLNSKTLKAYSIDLNQFVQFASLYNSLSCKETISNYVEFMRDKYKAKSIKRKIAALKAYFKYLCMEDIIEENPFNKIYIKIREPFVLPKVISQNTLTKLLNVAYSEIEKGHTDHSRRCALRNVAVLEMLFATGLRISELCNLKNEDVSLSNHYQIKTFGKGAKERVIQLCSPDVISVLKNYKKEFKKEIEHCGYFFVNKRTHRLSEQSVRFMINKYMNEVSEQVHITPHMFRHTVATMLLESDVDIRYIQQILGHSSITTTEIYTHVSSTKQRQILKKKHPRLKLQINKG